MIFPNHACECTEDGKTEDPPIRGFLMYAWSRSGTVLCAFRFPDFCHPDPFNFISMIFFKHKVLHVMQKKKAKTKNKLDCPTGICPTENSGCFPRGKPAATVSRYSTYAAC